MRRVALVTEDFVVGIKTRRGTFRVHLVGTTENLKAVGPVLDDIAGMSNSPRDFLDSALPELARHNVAIVETFDISPQAPSLGLVDRVRLISRTSRLTSADSFVHLLVTFQAAEPGELDALLQRPDDLSFVAGYVNSVLDDLDEQQPEATGRLREALTPTAANVILGP